MIKGLLKAALVLNLFALVSQNVASAEPLPFQTELGFKRLSDPTTPDYLRRASTAVFEVRSLSEEKAEDLKTIDLTDPKFSDIEQKIQSIPQLDDKEKLIIRRQIQHCRKQNSEKQCTLFFTIEKASGFIAGSDGTTFWTNAHVVNRFLKLRASLAQKSVSEMLKTDGRVAIFLFDQDGNLVFDPFDDAANVTIFDEPSTIASFRGDWYAEDTDYVGIKLGKSIGTPLRIGASPKPNDMLYRPGFAACTGCPDNPNQTDPLNNNDRGPNRNSTGQGLYWTSGQLQTLAIASSYLGLSSSLQVMYKTAQMIFFSADAQVGLSGSPIINDRGEVVGVFAGSKPKMYGNVMLNLSRGVRPPIFNQP